MPNVAGQQFPYTPEGMSAADEKRNLLNRGAMGGPTNIALAGKRTAPQASIPYSGMGIGSPLLGQADPANRSGPMFPGMGYGPGMGGMGGMGYGPGMGGMGGMGGGPGMGLGGANPAMGGRGPAGGYGQQRAGSGHPNDPDYVPGPGRYDPNVPGSHPEPPPRPPSLLEHWRHREEIKPYLNPDNWKELWRDVKPFTKPGRWQEWLDPTSKPALQDVPIWQDPWQLLRKPGGSWKLKPGQLDPWGNPMYEPMFTPEEEQQQQDGGGQQEYYPPYHEPPQRL